jgi:DNA modification methylase
MSSIAVRRAGLTEDQKVGLALADNRTSSTSANGTMRCFGSSSEEHDLTPWFEDDELLAEVLEPEEGLTDADDVPEVPEEPITKPGDLWILGNHRLLCGDSTDVLAVERLMDGKKADMVFTDPPYALFGNSTGVAGITDDKMIMPFFRNIFSMCRTHVKAFGHVYTCCDWHSCNAINRAAAEVTLPAKNLIVWDKGDAGIGGMFMNCHELIWFFTNTPENRNTMKAAGKVGERPVNGVANIWRIKKVPPKQREHNAAKPIELINIGIYASSNNGELILDLFGGSGSTLIACEETARKCSMMEMDPIYCDVIVKRWENFTGKKAMLEETKEAF